MKLTEEQYQRKLDMLHDTDHAQDWTNLWFAQDVMELREALAASQRRLMQWQKNFGCIDPDEAARLALERQEHLQARIAAAADLAKNWRAVAGASMQTPKRWLNECADGLESALSPSSAPDQNTGERG